MNNFLIFHHNWNNKLQNKAFTTIRLWNPHKYGEGAIFSIVLADKGGAFKTQYGNAAVIRVKRIKLHQINEYIARLDTGYSAEETKTMLQTMYKNKNIDWQTQDIALVLLAKVEAPKPTQQSIFQTL